MNCNLYKVIKYLRTNNQIDINDEDEDKLFNYFNISKPLYIKWSTELKIDECKKTLDGMITYEEYRTLKNKNIIGPNGTYTPTANGDTIINFGDMGPVEFNTTMKNIIFEDDEEITDTYNKRYISYDKNFLSYIK